MVLHLLLLYSCDGRYSDNINIMSKPNLRLLLYRNIVTRGTPFLGRRTLLTEQLVSKDKTVVLQRVVQH